MTVDNGQWIPVDDGAFTLSEIFGDIRAAASKLGPAVQKVTNDLANLQAQNDDIRNGRWTLNNAVYQWSLLDPLGKLAVIGAGWFLIRQLSKG